MARLSERLGFKRNLSLAEVETIFVSCVFSQAWQPKKGSAICQILDDDEIQILEYREDLEYFWQDGYGYDVNSRPGCVLMKDVFENFEQVVKVMFLLPSMSTILMTNLLQKLGKGWVPAVVNTDQPNATLVRVERSWLFQFIVKAINFRVFGGIL